MLSLTLDLQHLTIMDKVNDVINKDNTAERRWVIIQTAIALVPIPMEDKTVKTEEKSN
jgi:hypothetical protein